MAEDQAQLNCPTYPLVDRRRFSRTQVLEGVAASVLAASVIATAAGVGWLIIQLPNRLQQLEGNIARILANQASLDERFLELEKEVKDQDRRLIRLEVQ